MEKSTMAISSMEISSMGISPMENHPSPMENHLMENSNHQYVKSISTPVVKPVNPLTSNMANTMGKSHSQVTNIAIITHQVN